jgi:predicted dehydrogenase
VILPTICLILIASGACAAADLRVGLIGIDTSHATAFTQLLNDDNDPHHVTGARVVAAFKGGSPDIKDSWSRVEGYTAELRDKRGVHIMDTIEALCAEVDVVMLESVDGRPHLAQAKPVIAARKPLFVDKPVAGSLRDAIELYRLAADAKVPIFTSSSYRFYDSMVALKAASVGEIRAVISSGPAHLEQHHPDLYWYGIHPTEALFTILGAGCETVSRTTSADTDVVTGTWSDGRVGTLVALRAGPLPHKVIVYGTKGTAEQQSGHDDYAPLVAEIVRFFQTGVAPVNSEESLAIYAFMEAADESKRRGGVPVRITDVVKMNSR